MGLRLILALLALLGGARAMNSSKWLRAARSKTIIEPITNTWVVVPDLKLLFCFIPKNACSQFNKVMNALNGIDKLGEPCTAKDPNYKSSAGVILGPRKGKKTMKTLMNDLANNPSWTKGVFLRDPLDRLVSAFRSKCEPPRECGGLHCMNLDPKKIKKSEGPTFDEWMAEFHKSTDQHFTSQVRFCDGLSPKKLDKFDYVGLVTNNYTRVAEQVREMMKVAVARSQKNTGEGFLSKSRNVSSEEVEKAIRTYFPMSGPSESQAHNHRTADFMKFYQTPSACHKAALYYAEDYRLLGRFPQVAHPSC